MLEDNIKSSKSIKARGMVLYCKTKCNKMTFKLYQLIPMKSFKHTFPSIMMLSFANKYLHKNINVVKLSTLINAGKHSGSF